MVIENKYIPFKGFKAINLCGIIFLRKGTRPMLDIDINHEAIHTALMKELCYIFFYLLYIGEWICKLVCYGNNRKAYRNISFEKEAYALQNNLGYLRFRQPFALWRKGFGIFCS